MFKYTQMEPQRKMLVDLGVNGMSSDEEEKVLDGVQYRIQLPRWRAPNLTAWLRMFDAIHQYYRFENGANDMCGSLPRRRVATSTESQSRKFVSGLPINAYKASWLEEQLDVSNIVHPTPEIRYWHDENLIQYVLASNRVYSS